MNIAVVDNHRQLFPYSCIPMAVELVLKLLQRVSETFYDLQHEVGSRSNIGFGAYNGRTISGVMFTAEFALPRGDDFPIDELFQAIDAALTRSEYIIISLANPSGWHMYVIYEYTPNGDYRAVSKGGADGKKTLLIDNVKAQVRAMKGTDILTYKITE